MYEPAAHEAFKKLEKFEGRVVLMSWRFLKSAKDRKLSYPSYYFIYTLAVLEKR